MTKSTSLLLLLLCLFAFSLSACHDTEPPVDYNALVSSQVIADGEASLLKCAYNTDGRFLSVIKADFSLSPSDFGESIRLSYDESGVLSSIYMRKNVFGNEIPVTVTEGKLPASVKKDALEVRLTSVGTHVQKMLILKEDEAQAELSFDETGKLSSIAKYENGILAYTTSYTYEDKKTEASVSLPDNGSLSATLTFDEKGQPLTYIGMATEGDTSYTMTGSWIYDAETIFTLRLSDGADNDVNNEYRYTFNADGRRMEELLTIETYESKKLKDKTVFTKEYNASGECLSYSVDSYKDAIVLKKRFTEYFDWTGTTTQSTETTYNEKGKRISAFEIYLLADGRTNKTISYEYDTNDTVTKMYKEVFRYNANGEKIEQTSTEYNAQGKEVKAQVLSFDIFGNLLTREEIVYTHLLGIKMETYEKYDATGKLIAEGTREAK